VAWWLWLLVGLIGCVLWTPLFVCWVDVIEWGLVK
jgi:hypothetical protein